jgi:hypothetical protein
LQHTDSLASFRKYFETSLRGEITEESLNEKDCQ